jgi:DNA-binding response OmpR family regulator
MQHVIGPYTIDTVARTVHDHLGMPLKLSHSEFELLTLLIEKDHAIVTRDEITQARVGRNWGGTKDRTADAAIFTLRLRMPHLDIVAAYRKGYWLRKPNKVAA